MVDGNSGLARGDMLDEGLALALIGAASTAECLPVGGATMIIGTAGTLITVPAGDVPGRSGVWNAQEIRLLGPAPAPVLERLWEWTDLHLLVRVDEGLLYLGTGHVGEIGSHLPPGGTEYELDDCKVRPQTPLSRALLQRVRPPHPAATRPGLEWLDHVNGDRALALEQFVTGWYPATADDAEPPVVPGGYVDLPAGLAQLYELAMRRPGVLGVQNRMVEDLGRETDRCGDMRVIGVENQGGFRWSTLWTPGEPEDDPTVWHRVHDEPPVAENEPLSGFLLQFALDEAATGADYVAVAHGITGAEVEPLTRELRPVPLRPFEPGSATRFHVAPGLVLSVSKGWSEDRFNVQAGATDRGALGLLPHDGVGWLAFDG
ncbi:hypothetical protein [Actinacidiphila sp. bgisy160]|uniref:hypothetical protein n=1 Tax=Actinacidiphila sp. bgisy160 TaxID=3413796 RepID=UPI003D73FE77